MHAGPCRSRWSPVSAMDPTPARLLASEGTLSVRACRHAGGLSRDGHTLPFY